MRKTRNDTGCAGWPIGEVYSESLGLACGYLSPPTYPVPGATQGFPVGIPRED